MKKSYIYVIAIFIVIISVVFTSCNKSLKMVDNYGKTHIIATDENNQAITQTDGYVYEEVTNLDGKTMTRLIEYPTVSTNKNSSVMENFAVKMEVPKGWANSGSSSVFRILHSGKCADINESSCCIDVRVRKNKDYKELYDKNKKEVYKLSGVSSNVTDIKEYTVKIAGKDAHVISHHIDSEKITDMYYYIQSGKSVIEIRALIYDDCGDNDSTNELLNSCITFKGSGEDNSSESQTASENLSTAVAQ